MNYAKANLNLILSEGTLAEKKNVLALLFKIFESINLNGVARRPFIGLITFYIMIFGWFRQFVLVLRRSWKCGFVLKSENGCYLNDITSIHDSIHGLKMNGPRSKLNQKSITLDYIHFQLYVFHFYVVQLLQTKMFLLLTNFVGRIKKS